METNAWRHACVPSCRTSRLLRSLRTPPDRPRRASGASGSKASRTGRSGGRWSPRSPCCGGARSRARCDRAADARRRCARRGSAHRAPPPAAPSRRRERAPRARRRHRGRPSSTRPDATAFRGGARRPPHPRPRHPSCLDFGRRGTVSQSRPCSRLPGASAARSCLLREVLLASGATARPSHVDFPRGEVAERSKAAVLKTAGRESAPGVRIPPSPPAADPSGAPE